MLVGPTIPSVHAADFCRQAANAAVRACQATARHDGSLALGKCASSSSALVRRACNAQAAADAKDALKQCGEEADFRKASCARLGPDPYDPVIDPANFVTTIDNPYFPLKPGTTFMYEAQTADGFEHVDFAVTHNTRVLMGVTCIEIHDTAKVNGVLKEDTTDYFAQDRQGNVWYFGEATHELIDGLISTIAGTFLSGQNGAKPGIVMKAHPMVGDYYRQEFDLGNAEDFAEVISLNATASTPYGSFANVPMSAGRLIAP